MTSLQFRITLWITTDTVISQYRRIIGRLVFLFTESATNSLRISRKRAVLAHGFVFFSLICKMQVLASCSGLCGVTSRIGFRSRTRRAWESPSHATCSTSLSTTAHTAVEPLDRRWQNTNFCQRYYRSRVMASDSRQKMQRRPFLICSHGTWRIRPIKPKLLLARGSERFFQELRTYGAISVPEIYK